MPSREPQSWRDGRWEEDCSTVGSSEFKTGWASNWAFKSEGKSGWGGVRGMSEGGKHHQRAYILKGCREGTGWECMHRGRWPRTVADSSKQLRRTEWDGSITLVIPEAQPRSSSLLGCCFPEHFIRYLPMGMWKKKKVTFEIHAPCYVSIQPDLFVYTVEKFCRLQWHLITESMPKACIQSLVLGPACSPSEVAAVTAGTALQATGKSKGGGLEYDVGTLCHPWQCSAQSIRTRHVTAHSSCKSLY